MQTQSSAPREFRKPYAVSVAKVYDLRVEQIRTKSGSLKSVVVAVGKDGESLKTSNVSFGSMWEGSKARIINSATRDKSNAKGILGQQASHVQAPAKHRVYIDFTRERAAFDDSDDAIDTKDLAEVRAREFAGMVRLAAAIERLQREMFPKKTSLKLPIRESADSDWDEAPIPVPSCG
jgi:hypothetical protein